MEQLEDGIIEEVYDLNISDGPHVHYLPHHAIIRYDKETTKVRVVYDASAKSGGMSLNDCLHAGQNSTRKSLIYWLDHRYTTRNRIGN